MPSLIDIRRRIRAVKSTQQITKAMKMVAASRMRRAHDRVVNARPYSKGILRVLTSLASRVDLEPAPAAGRARHGKGRRADCRHRHHRRQGPGGQLQLEHREGGGPLPRRPEASAGRVRARRPEGARLLQAPAGDDAGRAGGAVHAADVTARRRGRRSGHRGVRERTGRRRVRHLQRVQVDHDAEDVRRAAAADPASRGGGRRRAARRWTICTSRTPRRSSESCCRGTSRAGSSRRCSNRTRRSTRRR